MTLEIHLEIIQGFPVFPGAWSVALKAAGRNPEHRQEEEQAVQKPNSMRSCQGKHSSPAQLVDMVGNKNQFRKSEGTGSSTCCPFSPFIFPCNQLGWIPWHSDNLMPLENWSLAKLWPAQLLPTHPTRSAARDGSWHLSISSSMVIASRNSSVESSTVASAQRPFQAIWGCPAIELRDVIWVKFLLYCDIFGKPEFFPYIPYEPEQWHLTSSNNLTASWKSSFQSS